MKKIIIAVIFMITASGILSAQTTKPFRGTPGTNQYNAGYVDSNKNSICDNYENRTRALAGIGQGQGRKKSGYGMCNRQCRSTMQGQRNGNRRRGW